MPEQPWIESEVTGPAKQPCESDPDHDRAATGPNDRPPASDPEEPVPDHLQTESEGTKPAKQPTESDPGDDRRPHGSDPEEPVPDHSQTESEETGPAKQPPELDPDDNRSATGPSKHLHESDPDDDRKPHESDPEEPVTDHSRTESEETGPHESVTAPANQPPESDLDDDHVKKTRTSADGDKKWSYEHCDVPQSQGQLGQWVWTQRKQYKLLREGQHSLMTEERIQQLEGIGFQWSGSKRKFPEAEDTVEDEEARKTRRATKNARYRRRRDALVNDLARFIELARMSGGLLKTMAESNDVFKHASPVPPHLVEDGMIKPNIEISEEAMERIRKELRINFSPRMKHCVYASDDLETACRVCRTKWNNIKTFFVYFIDPRFCDEIKNVGLVNDKCEPARACDQGKWKLNKACPIIKVVQVTLGSKGGMSNSDSNIELIHDKRNMDVRLSINLKGDEEQVEEDDEEEQIEVPSLPAMPAIEEVMDSDDDDGERVEGEQVGEGNDEEQVEDIVGGDMTMHDVGQFVAV
ncbi:hypothetical protein ACHAWF_018247 [Thalassiosira exigua]